ncbi:hypothetical protein GQ464_002280 [Rhodocaloribacter litoris]|uniref:hypothetical protein n=1 Tax=Rhodocaloribacter litoris TaxID=2558931 RepID=UPI001423E895|nr:hypothetical protein [Rhodocaloribacter litoris]QXD15797.1 hypothetical protein GQ464_002280 [Rhodocaloribacter litoris]
MYLQTRTFSLYRLRRGVYEIRIFRAPEGRRRHWFFGARRAAIAHAERLVTALTA